MIGLIALQLTFEQVKTSAARARLFPAYLASIRQAIAQEVAGLCLESIRQDTARRKQLEAFVRDVASREG